MECPPGMKNVTSEDVLALQKCIYGLVQAARQYHKKILSFALENVGLSLSSPSHLVRLASRKWTAGRLRNLGLDDWRRYVGGATRLLHWYGVH